MLIHVERMLMQRIDRALKKAITSPNSAVLSPRPSKKPAMLGGGGERSGCTRPVRRLAPRASQSLRPRPQSPRKENRDENNHQPLHRWGVR